MKSAVIYARYSSERQTEQSIEGQLRICNEFAKQNDLEIVDTYIDRAMTGTNDNRPAFQKMLKDAEISGLWQIVLVYAIDRFGRNSIEVAVNKQKLKKNKKTLISATQRTSENIVALKLNIQNYKNRRRYLFFTFFAIKNTANATKTPQIPPAKSIIASNTEGPLPSAKICMHSSAAPPASVVPAARNAQIAVAFFLAEKYVSYIKNARKPSSANSEKCAALRMNRCETQICPLPKKKSTIFCTASRTFPLAAPLCCAVASEFEKIQPRYSSVKSVVKTRGRTILFLSFSFFAIVYL